MSGFLENVIVSLSRLLGLSGRKIDVTPAKLADTIVVCETAKVVGVVGAVAEVELIEPVAVVAPVVDVLVVAEGRSRRIKLAMRLRYVAKVQRWKQGKAPKPVGKARANLKPKPVVVARGNVKKRGPSLFPTKMKPVTAKKATTRIYIEKKPKKVAEILKFPVRKPLPCASRLKRAA